LTSGIIKQYLYFTGRDHGKQPGKVVKLLKRREATIPEELKLIIRKKNQSWLI